MKHQIHTLFLVVFALILSSETAFAMNQKKGNPHQIAWQPLKPITIYPLAHTNQDDDEDQRRMFGQMPDDLSLPSGIRFLTPNREQGLLELMIRMSIPQGVDAPIQSDESTTPSIREFSVGFTFLSTLEEVENSKSVINKMANSEAPGVPAPGVLGLLALGGLTVMSRRRRH